MGLMDGLLGNLAGSLLVGGMLAAVMTLAQQQGGLTGVLDMFRGKGMAQAVDSWVGTGPNAAISADQVHQVFGGPALSGLAAQLGTSHGEASSMPAKALPDLINQLTPQGKIPENHGDLISQALSMLRGGSA